MHFDARSTILSVYADRLKEGTLTQEEQKEVSAVMDDVSKVFGQTMLRITKLEEIVKLSMAADVEDGRELEIVRSYLVMKGLTDDFEKHRLRMLKKIFRAQFFTAKQKLDACMPKGMIKCEQTNLN